MTEGQLGTAIPLRCKTTSRRNHQTSSELRPGMAFTGMIAPELAASKPSENGFL